MLTEHSFLRHAPLAPDPAAPFNAVSQSIALCLHSSSETFANRFSLQFLIAPLGPPQGPPPHPALSLKVDPSILAPVLTMGLLQALRQGSPLMPNT